MKRMYKGFEIATEGFKSTLPDWDGLRVRIIAKSKDQGNSFFFDVAGTLMDEKNLKVEQLLEEAIEVLKSEIDIGLSSSKAYNYEYQEHQFIEVEKPDWRKE